MTRPERHVLVLAVLLLSFALLGFAAVSVIEHFWVVRVAE
jgi:hypothetical protein